MQQVNIMELTAECPICMDDYSDTQPPSTFQCGHTFCTSCGKTLKKQGKITCPLDKSTFAVNEIRPNYEMLHLILESQKNFRISQEKQNELEGSLKKLQEEILESSQEKELILNEIQKKHKADVAKLVSCAVIETEEKGKRKLNKKLKEQEEKLTAKLEKEAKLRKEIEDKKRDETLKAILKKKEEEMNKAKKEKEDMASKVKQERKKINAEMQEKERKMKEQLRKQIEEEKAEQERQLQIRMEMLLQQEKEKLEQAARIKENELMQKYLSEQSALEKQQQEIKQKEIKMHEELKNKIEQMERENKERIESEEYMKRMTEEKMAKAQERIDQKMRRGQLPRNNGDRPNKESLQRDNERVYWAFRTQKGFYLEYFDDISAIIERNFAQDKSHIQLKKRGLIDFIKWKEVKDTGEETLIKRVNSLKGKAKWRFRDQGRWIDFNSQDNFDIEKAWLTRQPNVMVLCGKFLDFNTLVLNIEGQVLPVIRDVIKENY